MTTTTAETGLLHVDAPTMRRLLTPAATTDVLADTLRAASTPRPPARTAVPVPAGELLLMPAADHAYAGVKIAGVAPATRPSACPASPAPTCSSTARTSGPSPSSTARPSPSCAPRPSPPSPSAP
ncbi:hypothetical protein O1L60_01505 [Streptomyces diastatochromogenes]|nr:hypothetical protein [Streptomyces diastatochromogenes]